LAYKVTLLKGDGIGPEVAEQAVRCIEATGIDIDWEEVDAGEAAIKKFGNPLPDSTLDSIKRNKIALKAPLITPIGTGFRSVNVALRQKLDLFACVRPCKLYKGIRTIYSYVDVVIIRENTEDLYAGIEFEYKDKKTKELIGYLNSISGKVIKGDSAIGIKPISKTASERICKFAFEYALKNARKKVTVVHKANIMKFTDGIFLEAARNISKAYQSIIFDEKIVDNLSMQLVLRPQELDVMVLPNLYGDIISDLCAGLVGGLGVCPGANIGDEVAVFEPTHGSAPKYKGFNKVNPTAMILSGALMLRYLGEVKAAAALEEAVKSVIKDAKSVTYDLKLERDDPTSVGTKEMADAIINNIKI
jgi:isocitrate dehydrogenase (NAD+)